MQGLIVKGKKPVAQPVLGIPVTHEMVKALNTGKLVQKKIQVTNKSGKTFQVNKWVKPDQGGSSGKPKKDPEDVRGSKHGYGMHNIQNGDKISFKSNGKTMMGTVVDDSSLDGLVVKDAVGDKFPVAWKEITGFRSSTGSKVPRDKDGSGKGGGGKGGGRDDDGNVTENSPDFISPEKFNAAEWKVQHDDPNATEESVLESFGKDTNEIKKAISTTQARLKRLEQTIHTHRLAGEGENAVYDDERTQKHVEIIKKILTPEKIRGAMPEEGKRPTFTMLGGRGGSGKSWFDGQVYHSDKAIVLDADEIKGMLPEYEGYNAEQVHEESSDILERILAMAKEQGLNVVLDATMKTEKSAMRKIEAFKGSGYRIEAHYMHLPRQEAAKRAVSRFMGKTKRYVPIGVVLSNTGNEATFEAVKKHADAWSFRDNNVERGQEPKLISEYKA